MNRNKYTYNLVLAHSGSKGGSKYAGGFVQVGGRKNNSSAYNHDYYMKNKSKWLSKAHGKHSKRESDFHTDFEETMRRTGKTAQELFDDNDFDVLLMENGGYDTENMSEEEKTRLRENFKRKFGVKDTQRSARRAQAAVDDAEYNVAREMARSGAYQGRGRFAGNLKTTLENNTVRKYFQAAGERDKINEYYKRDAARDYIKSRRSGSYKKRK